MCNLFPRLFFFILIFIDVELFAQPFVDIVNVNSQLFSSTYKDSTSAKNSTNDYFFNFFYPKEFKNGNTLLVRLNGEQLTSSTESNQASKYNLYAMSLPVGYQLISSNKKWKALGMVIPKISSDFKDVSGNDFQMGGIVLFTYVKNENLKYKMGVYYNHEFFGNFFVPLVGVDWKINDRIMLYGVMPTNYKAEFKINKKLYCGINFKSYTRSYLLTQSYNGTFVKNSENQLKLFFDYYAFKKIVFYAEVGRTLGYNVLQYQLSDPKQVSTSNPVYQKFNNNFLFNIGIAYRIRFSDITTSK